jgi:hypothetical protein
MLPIENRDRYWGWYYPELVNANTREKAKQFAILASAGNVTEEQVDKIIKVLAEKMPEPYSPVEEGLIAYLKMEGDDATKRLKDSL